MMQSPKSDCGHPESPSLSQPSSPPAATETVGSVSPKTGLLKGATQEPEPPVDGTTNGGLLLRFGEERNGAGKCGTFLDLRANNLSASSNSDSSSSEALDGDHEQEPEGDGVGEQTADSSFASSAAEQQQQQQQAQERSVKLSIERLKHLADGHALSVRHHPLHHHHHHHHQHQHSAAQSAAEQLVLAAGGHFASGPAHPPMAASVVSVIPSGSVLPPLHPAALHPGHPPHHTPVAAGIAPLQPSSCFPHASAASPTDLEIERFKIARTAINNSAAFAAAAAAKELSDIGFRIQLQDGGQHASSYARSDTSEELIVDGNEECSQDAISGCPVDLTRSMENGNDAKPLTMRDTDKEAASKRLAFSVENILDPNKFNGKSTGGVSASVGISRSLSASGHQTVQAGQFPEPRITRLPQIDPNGQLQRMRHLERFRLLAACMNGKTTTKGVVRTRKSAHRRQIFDELQHGSHQEPVMMVQFSEPCGSEETHKKPSGR
ncbi:AGAP000484-PA-like protein [Anopheles sinensis]|uniref:AGAP000484-PA-like protein n=1 Tax=Anopheles sinensis TaxID=74873 RepID=A0A084VQB9_ANOSI|nr:AGAP000484-PA-like protein [Anopheles sinensis]